MQVMGGKSLHHLHLCHGRWGPASTSAAACKRAGAGPSGKAPCACTAAPAGTLTYTLPNNAPAQERVACKPHGEELQQRKDSHTRLPMRDLIKLIRGRGSSNTSQLPAGAVSTAERVAKKKEPNLILTSQIVSSKTWQEAYALFIEFSDVFNSINTAALITHISKLVHNSIGIKATQHESAGPDRLDLFEALQELRDFSEGEVPNYGPQGLANTACAFANLGILSRRYAQLVIARSEPSEFTNKELTQLLWSFGTAGFCPDAGWLRACYSELAMRRSSLTNRELCSTLWALARLSLDPGPGWMSIILFELSARASTLTEPDLANVLWALATLCHQPPRQLQSTFLMTSAKLAPGMSPKSLCTILWAASVNGWPIPPPWVNTMCEALHRHCFRVPGVVSMSASDAAMALHSLGRLKFQPPVEVTSSLSAVVVSQMGKDTATQDLVSWCCGLAGLGYKPSKPSLQRFFYACIKKRRLIKCQPNQLTAILCSLAKLDCELPPIFVASVCSQLLKRVHEWGPREISNTMWALAHMRQQLPTSLLSRMMYTLLAIEAPAPVPTSQLLPPQAQQPEHPAQAAPHPPQAQQPELPALSVPMSPSVRGGTSSPASEAHAVAPSPQPAGAPATPPAAMSAHYGMSPSHLRRQQQQHKISPPVVHPLQPLGALHLLQQQQQQQLPHKHQHLHQQEHQLQQQQQQQHAHNPIPATHRPPLLNTYTWSNGPPSSLPFSPAHPAAKAAAKAAHEAKVAHEAKTAREAAHEVKVAQGASNQGVRGQHMHRSSCQASGGSMRIGGRMTMGGWHSNQGEVMVGHKLNGSLAGGSTGMQGSSSSSSVGGSSSKRGHRPQHVANALWALLWLLPRGSRYTFGNTHRHMLRAAEREWMGPYFRAACMKQGTRGMLLGAELAGDNGGDTRAQTQSRSPLAGDVGGEVQARTQSSSPVARPLAAAAAPQSGSLFERPAAAAAAPGAPARQQEAAAAGGGMHAAAAAIAATSSSAVTTKSMPLNSRSERRDVAVDACMNASLSSSNSNSSSSSGGSSRGSTVKLGAAPNAPSNDAFPTYPTSPGRAASSLSSAPSAASHQHTSMHNIAQAGDGMRHTSTLHQHTSNLTDDAASVNGCAAASFSNRVRSEAGTAPAPAPPAQKCTAPAPTPPAPKRAAPPSQLPAPKYAMGHNVAAEELSRSMTVPPAELVQTAQAFAAMGYRPSAAWLHLHQWAAARQWPALPIAQRKRLVRCYRSLSQAGAARGANIGLAAQSVAGAACMLPMSSSAHGGAGAEGAQGGGEGGGKIGGALAKQGQAKVRRRTGRGRQVQVLNSNRKPSERGIRGRER